MHGKGKYSYADGNVYEGDWKDGKKHGKGKYSWASGDVYEGDVFVDVGRQRLHPLVIGDYVAAGVFILQ